MTGAEERHRDARRSIPAGPEAPGIARRFVAELLADHPRLDDIVLATSELATNAVRHPETTPERIDVEVHAGDPVHVAISHPGHFRVGGTDDGNGGWGLRMLAALVDRWGIDERAGVRAWFEVGRRSPGQRRR